MHRPCWPAKTGATSFSSSVVLQSTDTNQNPSTKGNNVQVFMPLQSIVGSLEALDDKRLLKQLVEAKQIITGTAFKHHPATIAWTPFIPALRQYVHIGAAIWRARGIKKRGVENSWKWDPQAPGTAKLPPFFGFEPYHFSHVCNLIRKSPDYISVLSKEIPVSFLATGIEAHSVPYLWPILVDGGVVYKIGSGKKAPVLTPGEIIESNWQWVLMK